jgi:GntR family transcriptional regulator, arabinose operon transcriptional repressor
MNNKDLQKLEKIGSFGTVALAQAMGKDIAQRFRAGDRFYTVRQVAKQYGVSLLTAHRGMQELAKRRILELRPGAGTFIGPRVESSRVKAIHLITTPEATSVPLLLEGLIMGLMKTLTGFSVQTNTEPAEAREEYLEELLTNRQDIAGVVLAAVSHETRVFFSKRNIPVVVAGYTEEDVELPSVDYPQRQMGRMVGEFLLDRGHTRLGFLPSEYWLPGDTHFLSGFQEVLAGRSIPADGFIVQPLPRDPDMARRVLQRMLQSPSRPSALICRRPWMSSQCLATVRELGLRVPGDILIASVAPTAALIADSIPSFTGFACDFELVGQTAGELLSKIMAGQGDQKIHVELPIQLTAGGTL